jgi:hypothetical protein
MFSLFNRMRKRADASGRNTSVKPDAVFAASNAPVGLPKGLLKQPVCSAPWVRAIRDVSYLYPPSDGALISTASKTSWFSARVAPLLDAAEGMLRHEFDLLGSGVFVSVDPERPIWESGYRPIDWNLDPVRNLRFPSGFPFKSWNLYEKRPENADVKYPWEIARCQHWTTLMQAWLVTRDDRFAQEIANQLTDFMDANPIGIGINYTCTMDVGIRALNWAIALNGLRECDALADDWWCQAYQALQDHCRFIYDNLENHYEVTSNHLLSNVVGLHFACQPFRGTQEGNTWHDFCRASLETEIGVQVLDDGADFESSIPYHRLVTELFLGSACLAKYLGEPLSHNYHRVLEKMVDYLVGILRPDGKLPQVGDADDGRLHIMTRLPGWDPQAGQHILGPAGVLLNRPDLIPSGGPDMMWEVLWWGLSTADLHGNDDEATLPPVCRLFPDAGHAIWRSGCDYLLLTNSIVGTNGFGNHKHNDQLSFEAHLDGVPLVVDPGSYVYTSDFDLRNKFRGTRSHSTLQVDSEEQNEMRPEWIFRMFDTGAPEHLYFEETEKGVGYGGRHVGYERLVDKVSCRRHFWFDKAARVLLIKDRVEGQGSHNLLWHFHMAPEVRFFASNGSVVWVADQKGEGRLFGLASLDAIPSSIQDAWYSPSYGKRVPTFAVEFNEFSDLENVQERRFVLATADSFESDVIPDAMQNFEDFLMERGAA